jgi:single-strand DNA-binding protein
MLIGNLGRDPETRYMPNGESVTTFSLATTDKWVDKQSGEKQERTEWHNITAFRKCGEVCGKFLKKGSSIYCEGKLQTQKYTDKDGIEKYATKIVIDVMQMLGSRTEQAAGEGEATRTQKANIDGQFNAYTNKQINELKNDMNFNDDIPF